MRDRPTIARFGDNLRRVRQATGARQADVAAASGVAIETISRIERGKSVIVSIDLAEKLANAIKVPLSDLLGEAPKPQDPPARPALERIKTLLAPLDDEALESVYLGLRHLLSARPPRRR
jgi:transcriptional regulator with XRE-family HTH domain